MGAIVAAIITSSGALVLGVANLVYAIVRDKKRSKMDENLIQLKNRLDLESHIARKEYEEKKHVIEELIETTLQIEKFLLRVLMSVKSKDADKVKEYGEMLHESSFKFAAVYQRMEEYLDSEGRKVFTGYLVTVNKCLESPEETCAGAWEAGAKVRTLAKKCIE